jgi:hypothetical protein
MLTRFLAWLDQFLHELVNGDSETVTIDHTTPSMPETTPDPIQPVAPPVEAPALPQSLLNLFVNEIQNMEGWTPGSSSFVRNNPGNLRCPPLNALATKCQGGFCVFKDHATGLQALKNVTLSCAKGQSAVYNNAANHLFGLPSGAELNLYQYFTIRDPATDNNQPNLLAERFGRVLNVNPTTFRMKHLLA